MRMIVLAVGIAFVFLGGTPRGLERAVASETLTTPIPAPSAFDCDVDCSEQCAVPMNMMRGKRLPLSIDTRGTGERIQAGNASAGLVTPATAPLAWSMARNP